MKYIIYGKCGTGKTTKVKELINEHKDKFDTIIYLDVNCDNSLKFTANNIYKIDCPYIEDVLNTCAGLPNDLSKTLIIIDDMLSLASVSYPYSISENVADLTLYNHNRDYMINGQLQQEKQLTQALKDLLWRKCSLILVNPFRNIVKYNAEIINMNDKGTHKCHI